MQHSSPSRSRPVPYVPGNPAEVLAQSWTACRAQGRSSLAVAVVGWGGAEKEGSRYVPGNTLMILARVGLRAG